MAKQRDNTHLYKTGCLVCGHEVFTTEEAEYHAWAYDAEGRPLPACPDCGRRFGHTRLLHAGEQCVLQKDPVGRLVQHACGEVLLARDWDSFFWRRDGKGPVFRICPKCDKYISFLEKPLFEETAIKPYHEGKPKQEDKAPTVGLDPDIWGSLFDPNGATVPEPAPVKRQRRNSKKPGGA
jgi:hypothetical protein